MLIVGDLLALIVTIVFMFILRPVAAEVGLLDVPGGRKRHGEAVPIIGGAAMLMGLSFGTSLIDAPDFWHPVMLGICLLVVVGVIDDRFDLPPAVRLIAQTSACLLAVFAADLVIAHLGSPLFFDAPLGRFAPVFTIVVVLSMVNAFNVVDGIDGLAGGLALVTLVAMAIVGVGNDAYVLCLLMLAVVIGFLLFNFPLSVNRPVRAFMGDAGSTSLGLVVACLGIALSQGPSAQMTPVVGLWFAAVPIYDLFSAFTRRSLRGQSPFAPDYDHLHHVLMENGLSSGKTLGFMLVLAIIAAAFGLYGQTVGASDGVMFTIWAFGGFTYYHMIQHPGRVIAFVESLLAIARKAKA